MDKPAYYAILPASVRYDNRLKPAEKILFAEISALTDARGYCFAKNSYFANLYGAEIRTVKRWLEHLKALGYIGVEIIRDERGLITERRITLGPDTLRGVGTEMSLPTGQKCPYRGDKNVPHINTRDNKQDISSSPVRPDIQQAAALEDEDGDKISRAFRAAFGAAPTEAQKALLDEYREKGAEDSLLLLALDRAREQKAHSFGYVTRILAHALSMGATSAERYDRTPKGPATGSNATVTRTPPPPAAAPGVAWDKLLDEALAGIDQQAAGF